MRRLSWRGPDGSGTRPRHRRAITQPDVRQMYDMQQGARKGLWADLMKPVVEKLTEEDMLNIAAYTSSLKP